MGDVSPAVYRPGPWLRPAGWVSFLLGMVGGVGWLAALLVAVGRSALLPSLPDAPWLRLALSALLLAVAPLLVLGLVGIKRRLRRRALVRVVVLTLLGLVPAACAVTQLPRAGTTVASLGPVVLCFILSSPMFSLGVTLAALTVGARGTPTAPTDGWRAPAVLAACGFGAVGVALGVLGVLSSVSAPPPDCTGQRLGCGAALVGALRLEALSVVIVGTVLLFVLALSEGMLGYWLSAVLTHRQGDVWHTGR